MIARISEDDSQYVWHPYSQHGLKHPILPVISAHGAYLNVEGQGLVLDAISSWWVNLHGHSHPEIAQAIATQASEMEHVIFAGFTHEPAVALAGQLLNEKYVRDRTSLSKVFFSDNGSTAVEVALKMAFQYHHNLGSKTRVKFIALHGAYHGDTLAAMAVGEPDGFHRLFQPLLPKVDFVKPGDLDSFKELVQKGKDQYACFIFEPLVQGASGMRMYDSAFLRQIVEICKENQILTIADEVFTGFFRTGTCFASEIAEVRPDFLCLSKGITGGFLPLAATLVTQSVYDAFVSNEIRTAFLHGHSYTANPIACAAALKSWQLLHSASCQEKIYRISQATASWVEYFRQNPKVKDARAIGTIGAVEMSKDLNYFSGSPVQIMRAAIDRGVLIRPLGNVLYAVPPYCCSPKEIDQIYETMGHLIDQFC